VPIKSWYSETNPNLRPRQITEKGPNLGGLLVAFVIFLTSITGVAFGIVAAYGAVNGILHVFAYQSRERSRGTSVLVPSETHASGD
jgi:hypothetical protein